MSIQAYLTPSLPQHARGQKPCCANIRVFVCVTVCESHQLSKCPQANPFGRMYSSPFLEVSNFFSIYSSDLIIVELSREDLIKNNNINVKTNKFI